MASFVVCGLINFETTLRVPGFPLAYNPVNYPFHGVSSSVSGVGFNVASALSRLGNEVHLLSYIGQDPVGRFMHSWLREIKLSKDVLETSASASPQSVILFDSEGKRQIHVDLKKIQELAYPLDRFAQAAKGCALAALCNVNFSRPLLWEAHRLGLTVATDIHAISRLDDEYNHDFMRAADILFMSHESLPCTPTEWARRLMAVFPTRIAIIGLGREGALMARRDTGEISIFPAFPAPRVVNTIGAGDALFSAFIHWFTLTGDPAAALSFAQITASLKISGAGGAESLPDEATVLARALTLNVPGLGDPGRPVIC